jgi:hypothetical protein
MKRRSVLVVVALAAVMLAGSACAPALAGGPGFVLPAPNVPGFVEFHIEDVNGVVAEGSGPAQLKGLVAAYEKKSDAQTYRQDIYTNTDQITPSEGFTGVMATYIYNRQRLLGQGCSTCETVEDRYLTFQYPSPADPGVRDNVFFDDRTDGVTITLETIEPWAGCPDGDAGVIRASGPVPRLDGGTASLVIARC